MFPAFDPAPVVVMWAPGTPAGTWSAASSPVPFHLGLPAGRDVTAEDAAAELDVALRAWTRPSCSGFRARYAGTTTATAADDGVNVVMFHDDAWPANLTPGVVAQTVVSLDGNGSLRDADIHLNGKDFRFSLDGAPGTQDLRSVLVHEIGHALGLGHSDDPIATMYTAGSGQRWRSLEADDVLGVCTLYPGTGAPGCDATPCPTGLVCVAGGCQRKGARADVCAPCARVPGACEAAGEDARCIDLPGGRVCARACKADGDCGAGFHCKPTSAAGDLQCVSDDACRSAANTCATDTECPGYACRDGACVGPGDAADAGADASVQPAPDAGTTPEPGDAGGGGCDCRAASSRADVLSFVPLALALSSLARAWRSRRGRARRAAAGDAALDSRP